MFFARRAALRKSLRSFAPPRPSHVVTFAKLSHAMRAAAHQRAAAATGPCSAAVAALHVLLDSALDGATRAAARLLLCERWASSHSGKQLEELQKVQGCQGRAAAANSGVRRSRDSSRAARRTAADVVAGCGRGGKEKMAPLVNKSPQAQELQLGERLATGDTVFEAKGPGAIGGAGERAGVSTNAAE
eukprot:6966311-Prymnesium_polylepis.2